jgi:hypothetical protein
MYLQTIGRLGHEVLYQLGHPLLGFGKLLCESHARALHGKDQTQLLLPCMSNKTMFRNQNNYKDDRCIVTVVPGVDPRRETIVARMR